MAINYKNCVWYKGKKKDSFFEKLKELPNGNWLGHSYDVTNNSVVYVSTKEFEPNKLGKSLTTDDIIVAELSSQFDILDS